MDVASDATATIFGIATITTFGAILASGSGNIFEVCAGTVELAFASAVEPEIG